MINICTIQEGGWEGGAAGDQCPLGGGGGGTGQGAPGLLHTTLGVSIECLYHRLITPRWP